MLPGSRLIRRVARVLAILLVTTLLAPWGGHAASGAAAESIPRDTPSRVASATPCHASLSLTLEPGQHFPGSFSTQVPDDLPPGPLVVSVPLYPGATTTQETETLPSFSVPGVDYMKSASVTYRTADGMDAVQDWYENAFAACGFTMGGTQVSGQGGVQLSQGIDEAGNLGGIALQIDLSFAAARDGGTIILYVAIAITPPEYPVAGSILRVPGTPVSLDITHYSAAANAPSRPMRTVTVDDAATVASLAHEINYLPKLLGVMHCPLDQGAHDSLLFHYADGSTHPVYVGLQGCRFVSAPPAPPGVLGADPHLLPAIEALLKGHGSRTAPYPYDARTLRVVAMRRLGAAPGRFLSHGQNGTNLLYLSQNRLFTEPASGGTPRLLARGIADGAFDGDDLSAVARPVTSRDSSHLLRIDMKTGARRPFTLPAGAALLGRTAGAGSASLEDALGCWRIHLWYTVGGRVGGVDPEHPADDRFQSARFLPARVRGNLMALSCSEDFYRDVRARHGDRRAPGAG